MNHNSPKKKYRGTTTSMPDYWFECAKRCLDESPLVRSYLDQLLVNPSDSLCHSELNRAISRFDAEEVLNPEPFRRTNPKGNRVNGPIRLGTVYHTGAEWGIDPESLNTHLVTIGRTGSGKSSLVRRILRGYLQSTNQTNQPKKGLIVFDIKGEYADLALSYPEHFLYLKCEHFQMNLAEPPAERSATLWYSVLAEITRASFELRFPAEMLFTECLIETGAAGRTTGSAHATLYQVLEKLYARANAKSGGNLDVAKRLAGRIRSMIQVLGSAVAGEHSFDWGKLSARNIVIDVSGLSGSFQKFFILCFVAAILHYRISNRLEGEGIEVLCAMDECSRLFPKQATSKSALLISLIQIARSYQVGFIFCSQSTDIDSEIFANTSIQVALSLGHGSHYGEFASATGLTGAQSAFHRGICVPGDAIVRDRRTPAPYTVHIDAPEARRVRLSAKEVEELSQLSAQMLFGENVKQPKRGAALVEGDIAGIKANQEFRTGSSDSLAMLSSSAAVFPEFRAAEDRLTEAALFMLRSQITYGMPFLFRSESAQLAGVKGMATLQKAEKAALAQGYIEKLYLPRGKTNVCLWQPLPAVYKALSIPEPQWGSKGGYLHKLPVHRIKETFERDGWIAKIEYRLANGKLVDLACWRNDQFKLIECCASYPLEKELVNLSLDTEHQEGERSPDELMFAVIDRRMKEPLNQLIAEYLTQAPVPFPVCVVLAGDLIKPLELS